MTRQIGKLESMGPAVPACEQPMVQQAAALVQQMEMLTSEPGQRANLQAEANALDNVLQTDAHFARVAQRSAYLERNLGMTELYR
jgi:hypothetical protein